MTIQTELESLKKETDVMSTERKEKLEAILKLKQNEIGILTEIWERKKLKFDTVKEAKSKLEEARIELDQAQRENNFEKASRITYSTIPKLLEKIPQDDSWDPTNIQDTDLIIHDFVTPEDIAAVVSKTTGIPLKKLQSREIDKLVHMEDTLRLSVCGQDEALSAVANAVRMQRAGLSGENRPLASFMFLGPTGVGKT